MFCLKRFTTGFKTQRLHVSMALPLTHGTRRILSIHLSGRLILNSRVSVEVIVLLSIVALTSLVVQRISLVVVAGGSGVHVVVSIIVVHLLKVLW